MTVKISLYLPFIAVLHPFRVCACVSVCVPRLLLSVVAPLVLPESLPALLRWSCVPESFLQLSENFGRLWNICPHAHTRTHIHTREFLDRTEIFRRTGIFKGSAEIFIFPCSRIFRPDRNFQPAIFRQSWQIFISFRFPNFFTQKSHIFHKIPINS